jgi:peptidoglycan/xylan/chitin deacetylase (PgdA/CDA1 family)
MVFAFHRVAPFVGYPSRFDDSMYSIDAALFREHLMAMRLYADPVSESDLLAAISGRATLPRRGFMITFDEGYKDNATIAAPILKELGLPATFFVATQAIEERILGWWDHIYWALKHATRQNFSVRGISYDLAQDVGSVAEQFTALYKSTPLEQIDGLLEELMTACGSTSPSAEDMDAELMNWDDLRMLVSQGFAIGSHTHSHPVLSRIPPQAQRAELIKSKALIESHLDVPVRTMAYPVGGYEHFNLDTKRIAAECGYEAAFSFLTGGNDASHLDPFDMKRVDQPLDLPSYAGVFSMPWLFAKRTCYAEGPTAYEEQLL